MQSFACVGGGSSYIYAELAQAFACLSAVYGGAYMLNKPDCKVESDEEGKVHGVTSEGETAKCKKVVCDPSYLLNKAATAGTYFVALILTTWLQKGNSSHFSQPKQRPMSNDPETELKPATDLLGHVDEIFFETFDIYEPLK